MIAVDYGHPPWIALVLAFSFGMYGFCKKRANAGAVPVARAVETGVQFVPALIVLADPRACRARWCSGRGLPPRCCSPARESSPSCRCCSSPSATRRLPLSILGLLQYLAPVLQFAVGVGIRHESLPPAELVGFCLVWLALIVLTVDSLRHSRSTRRRTRFGVAGSSSPSLSG